MAQIETGKFFKIDRWVSYSLYPITTWKTPNVAASLVGASCELKHYLKTAVVRRTFRQGAKGLS